MLPGARLSPPLKMIFCAACESLRKLPLVPLESDDDAGTWNLGSFGVTSLVAHDEGPHSRFICLAKAQERIMLFGIESVGDAYEDIRGTRPFAPLIRIFVRIHRVVHVICQFQCSISSPLTAVASDVNPLQAWVVVCFHHVKLLWQPSQRDAAVLMWSTLGGWQAELQKLGFEANCEINNASSVYPNSNVDWEEADTQVIYIYYIYVLYTHMYASLCINILTHRWRDRLI